MLRGENIVCGTSTTGTGTLTLAAVPSGVGGVDFDAWLKSTGIGFVSGNAILVSYTIIEYTSSSLAVAKFVEKGIGTLTLGAALVNATLARTTVQTVSNANADTYQVGGGASAITIGTAANVLVFIGASASDVPAYGPYYETALGDALGVSPVQAILGTQGNTNLVTAKDYYMPFEWRMPMLAKKASVRVQSAYSTGSPVSDAYLRLYAVNSSGRPGKLLIDFGLLGSAGTSLNTGSVNISSAVHASGFYMTPGHYFMGFICTLSGGSTAPKLATSNSSVVFCPGFIGTTAIEPNATATATSGTATPAPDPANTTGYAVQLATSILHYFFALSPS